MRSIIREVTFMSNHASSNPEYLLLQLDDEEYNKVERLIEIAYEYDVNIRMDIMPLAVDQDGGHDEDAWYFTISYLIIYGDGTLYMYAQEYDNDAAQVETDAFTLADMLYQHPVGSESPPTSQKLVVPVRHVYDGRGEAPYFIELRLDEVRRNQMREILDQRHVYLVKLPLKPSEALFLDKQQEPMEWPCDTAVFKLRGITQSVYVDCQSADYAGMELDSRYFKLDQFQPLDPVLPLTFRPHAPDYQVP